MRKTTLRKRPILRKSRRIKRKGIYRRKSKKNIKKIGGQANENNNDIDISTIWYFSIDISNNHIEDILEKTKINTDGYKFVNAKFPYHITMYYNETGSKVIQQRYDEFHEYIGKEVSVCVNKINKSKDFIVIGVESIKFEGKDIPHSKPDDTHKIHITVAMREIKEGEPNILAKDSPNALTEYDETIELKNHCFNGTFEIKY